MLTQHGSRRAWTVVAHPDAGGAGLRVGYGAFPTGLISYLWRAKQPYNVSVAAEVAACAALSEPAYLEVTPRLLPRRNPLDRGCI